MGDSVVEATQKATLSFFKVFLSTAAVVGIPASPDVGFLAIMPPCSGTR
jgi:hypothetical protein